MFNIFVVQRRCCLIYISLLFQVKNPKISSGEFILKFEENEECLPKSKRRADLEKVEPKVNQKKVTNARKSLFSGLRTSLRRRKPVD